MADTVFKLDPDIIVGTDTVNRAGTILAKRGTKVLVATEQILYENNLIERLLGILEDSGLETILFDEIPAQATAEVAETAASLARGARCDMIIGFGGLKVQYIAKLISILTVSPFALFDLLDGKMEERSFLPFVAIPTTGGDPFLFSDQIVAIDPRDRNVKLVKCPRGLCAAVILDPGISESLSGQFAPTVAFDGLCLSLEAYCSTKSSFLSDALLEQAITIYSQMMHSYSGSQGAGRGLVPDMPGLPLLTQVADFPTISVNGGFLLSLGASTSAPGIGTALTYAINGKFPVAKSWCATVLLPYIMEKLVAARPEKMAKVAAIMGEYAEGAPLAEAANLAVDLVRRKMGQLAVPARLKDFKLSLDRLVPTAEAARNLEFVAFSPWTVTAEDAYDLLKQAF